jgi:hypothetical protein
MDSDLCLNMPHGGFHIEFSLSLSTSCSVFFYFISLRMLDFTYSHISV